MMTSERRRRRVAVYTTAVRTTTRATSAAATAQIAAGGRHPSLPSSTIANAMGAKEVTAPSPAEARARRVATSSLSRYRITRQSRPRAHVVAHPLDDRFERRPRGEHAGDPRGGDVFEVRLRDDPAPEHHASGPPP